MEGGVRKRAADEQWSTVLAEATSEPTFLELAEQHCPRDSVLFSTAIAAYARKRFRQHTEYNSPYGITDFRTVDKLSEFWGNWIQRPQTNKRPKSLILVGPSRWGKTAWARSLGTHAYCHSYYHLDTMIKEPKDYFIIDDVPFERFPPWKAILGCQSEITLTDKYRAKIKLPWGIPTIVLWNEDMYKNFIIDLDFKKQNCEIVILQYSLIP